MFPNRVPIENEAPSSEPLVYSFIYIRQRPQLRSPSTKIGNTVTVHGAQRRRKAHIQWGAARFPKGIVCDTAVTTQCHAAFSTTPSTLAWVDKASSASVCRSNLHQGSPSTPLTTSHVTQGKAEYESI